MKQKHRFISDEVYTLSDDVQEISRDELKNISEILDATRQRFSDRLLRDDIIDQVKEANEIIKDAIKKLEDK